MVGGVSQRLIVLAMIVAISFTSACSRVYEGAGSAFFRPPRRETSDRLDVLERRLARLQSEMGITAYDFEFNVPRGNKLLATLRADLNGQVVPELSGVFHVPASNDPRLRYGHVTIYYTDPPLSSEPTVPGAWQNVRVTIDNPIQRTVRIVVVATDGGPDSTVEAGIDDIRITRDV